MQEGPRDLYERGRVALAEQHPVEARALLEQAASSCTEPELALRISISLALVRFEEDGLPPALDELAEAIRAAEELGLAHLAAAAAVQTGVIHARTGDLNGAWTTLDGVDVDTLPADDRLRTLLNRGAIASQLGRFDAAAADLSAAAGLADDLDAQQFAFMARHNLGWVQFLRGDLPAALREMHDADARPVDLDRSVARLDRARVLLEAGLPADAHDLLLRAREGQSGAQQIAEIDLDLARSALLLGRPDEALLRAEAAAAVFRARGAAVWLRRARLVELLAQPRWEHACALLADALGADDRVVAGQAAAAGLMVAPDGAELAGLVAEVRSLTRSPVLSLRLAGLVALAAHSAREGEVASARRLLVRANRDVLRAQLGVASLDLRTATALHGEAAASLDAQLAQRLGPEEVIATSERWRSAIRPAPRVRPSADPRIAAVATELRHRRVEYDPAGPDAVRDLADIVAAERELRALTWGADSPLPPSTTTLSTARLERAAHEATATLVVTAVHEDRFVAVVLGDGPARQIVLGDVSRIGALLARAQADLAARASLGPAHPLAGVIHAALARSLERLGDEVATALAGLPGQLVIVPTRGLSGVPWLSLPTLRGRPITVAPTASSWARMRTVVRMPRVSAHCGPDVPHARAEAEAIARSWTSTRPGGLLEALARDDLVHIAAHGEHRGDNPLFSSLLMDDGPLFAHELEAAEIHASQIVLSACEVGRATHRPGDQPLGLTATLLAAGVATVIAPVAPIGDSVAAEVMGRYHAELARGIDAATALAHATAFDPSAGAFVCFGAPWRAMRGERSSRS